MRSSRRITHSGTVIPGFRQICPLRFEYRARRPSFFCWIPPVRTRACSTRIPKKRSRRPDSSSIWSQPFSRIFFGRGGTGITVIGKSALAACRAVDRHCAKEKESPRTPVVFQALRSSCPSPAYEYRGMMRSIAERFGVKRHIVHKPAEDTRGLPQMLQRVESSCVNEIIRALRRKWNSRQDAHRGRPHKESRPQTIQVCGKRSVAQRSRSRSANGCFMKILYTRKKHFGGLFSGIQLFFPPVDALEGLERGYRISVDRQEFVENQLLVGEKLARWENRYRGKHIFGSGSNDR